MIKDNSLAVLILTYNEEDKVVDCIRSVEFADEVIIIDSGSTDQTIHLAEKCGAKVYYHSMDEGFAVQRNYALEKTNASWVLYLDADERITPEAGKEIINCVASGLSCAYRIKRMNIVFGKMLRYGGHAPDYVTRLFPRESVFWEGIVHEHPNISLPIKKLAHVIHHYTYTDWDRYFIKFNQYTSLMAKKMHDKGKKANFMDLTLRPLYAFIRFYILKSGWRDGKMGFVFAIFHGFYTLVKYVKLYYWQVGEERK